MGITKQYLRWEEGSQFGIIGSQCQAICLLNQWPEMLSTSRICASASCENIVFWDSKTSQLIDSIETTEENPDQLKTSPISCLAYSSSSNVITSGHCDGSVRLFDCQTKQTKVVFSGHKGFVSCVVFDETGLRIASAGKDTEIVIWDVTNSSGLFRLKGHKGVVNKVAFMKQHDWILISASSDTFIKFWDLNTQHCFKTLADHRSEVWSFVVLKNDTRLITGGSDSELKVWKIMFPDDIEQFQEKAQELKSKRLQQLELIGETIEEIDDLCENDEDNFFLVERYGTILRKSTERTTNIFLDPSESLLLCHGKDQYFECFKIRDDIEIKNKIKKRLKRERKRRSSESLPDEIDDTNLFESCTLSDEIEKLDSVKVSSRIKCLDVKIVKRNVDQKEFNVALLLSNNSIEFIKLFLKANTFESEQLSMISTFGHRADVRTISVSSDSITILTASSDAVKLWNKSSCRCINTVSEDIDYPLCSVFAPGDKHAILGTKSGKIQILNLTTAQVHSTIEASEGSPIWSVCLLPDLTGIVSGCEDKSIKFWSFDLVVDPEDGSRNLTLCHEKTFEADEGVICTKMSPNSKFVAASLLDSTVKIYFADTFKFFLSLYGHKFPVLCMDISSDNSLIVTGSSDKNIKIWGMDFGDCHRSLFAHDDNIMCLSFIPRTHQFFTASKDHKIKLWDADNFEKVTTLEGHHGEIWAMAVSPNGKYLVSASHDKSIRIWNKTNEPLILEEEKELENEKQFEKEMDDGSTQAVVPGEGSETSGLAHKKTVNTIRSVEKVMEGINVFNEEMEKSKHYQRLCLSYEDTKRQNPEDTTLTKPVREPVNMNLLYYRTECPHRFMLEIISRIKSNELEETLLELPFSYTRQLLSILSELLERKWEVELVCRCICFIIRINFGQITSTPSLTALMDKIRVQIKQETSDLCDLFGVNIAGLQHYQSVLESREDATLFAESLRENRSRKQKKHKSVNRTAPILTWT